PRIPGMEKLQREFMEKALVHFQDFLKQKGDDPALRFEVARTMVHVAGITSHIGDKREALAHYNQAITLLDDLAAEKPEREINRWRAMAYINRGVTQSALGLHPDARDSYLKARELDASLRDAKPNDAEARASAALVNGNLGNSYRMLGQHEKAHECLQQ